LLSHIFILRLTHKFCRSFDSRKRLYSTPKKLLEQDNHPRVHGAICQKSKHGSFRPRDLAEFGQGFLSVNRTYLPIICSVLSFPFFPLFSFPLSSLFLSSFLSFRLFFPLFLSDTWQNSAQAFRQLIIHIYL
jgi:hypothetical protein